MVYVAPHNVVQLKRSEPVYQLLNLSSFILLRRRSHLFVKCSVRHLQTSYTADTYVKNCDQDESD